MRRPIKKSHPIRKLLLIIAVFGLIALFYLYNQYNYQINTPVNPTNTEEVIVTVKKGDNIKKIASKLFEEKLILGEESFKLYARLNNLDTQIKTGRFPLSQNMTVPEIFATLSSDEQREAV
ncbi:endolytic transglycosylase MltG, partial [Candidatus Peregrinibacteria bacterium]|nr:endolytic transglycosylase MltG [Candidatus Peregrinibacteria bacterium]